MAGGEATAAVGENPVQTQLRLVHDVIRISSAGFSGSFKKDCTDLARRISLLAYLLEEIREIKGDFGVSSSSNSYLFDLSLSLQAAKKLLFAANNFDPKNSTVSNDFVCLLPFTFISNSSSCSIFGNGGAIFAILRLEMKMKKWVLLVLQI